MQLSQNVQPSLRLEATKADKREGTLFRRLDSIAGLVSRRFHEESAIRKAATTLLGQKIDNSTEWNSAEEYLSQLRTVRQQLQEERKQRREEDARVLKEIQEATDSMKRALLQAAGSGDS